MKLATVVIVVCLACLMMPMPSGAQGERADPDLKPYWGLHGIYTNHLSAIDAKYGTQDKRIADQYLKALDQLALAYQNKGDLKGVVAVRAELELVKRQFEVPGADADNEPAELRELKTTTRALPITLAAQRAKEVSVLATAYLTRLTTLQTELTKQGKVDTALFIQKEADSIAALCSTLEAPARQAGDLSAAGTAASSATGVQAPALVLPVPQPAPEAPQEVAYAGDANPAATQAALLGAINDDIQQGKNAWAAKKPLLAVCCYRNAQALSLIVQRDPDFDNRSKIIHDSLAMIEAALQSTPLVQTCSECAGTGRVQIELRSLVGTQPTKGGPVGTKICTTCRGSKTVSKILDAAARQEQEKEAERAYGDAQAPTRTQIGLTWVPAAVATHLRPRLRVILIRSRMSNVCTVCNGNKKPDCYRCNGTGQKKACLNCGGNGVRSCYCGGRRDACPMCSGAGETLCMACIGTGLSRY